MQRDELINLVKGIALRHKLFDYIVCGICEQESTWVSTEVRFEPGWYNRTDWAKLIAEQTHPRFETDETERVTRSMSWGLMQVLGQSIREIGFTDWLPALADEALGVEWGCQLLERKIEHAGGDITRALLLWNGGGNAAYPSQVLAKSEKYK